MNNMSEKAYEAIELARKTGKIIKGTNEVTKAIEKDKAKLVIYAKDITPPEIIMHLPLLAKEKGIPCIEVPSKDELGAAAGLKLGTASVAIVNPGDAKDLVKELGGK
jgi:large subunit ribosomal protein L7Ae